ncbi:MAG TPA: ATP-dependent RecD-like DNA helicase [Vicinamibacterales bacterium]|nr:ATP-dependent RecD-like DNA helicase [Vicinamibacterales bacterium]
MEQPRLLDNPSPAVEHLTGVVERVVFHNEENGFSVLRLAVRGRREVVTLVGHAPAVSPGEYIQAEGSWKHDRVHGLQFQASSMHAVTPTTIEGIEKYLASGLVKGIGPHFASRLVAAFGTQVFDVIERDPRRLRSVEGIGRTRAVRIVEAWREQKSVRDIMVFLHSHGVGSSRAVRIFKTYGRDAIAVISENPYRLAADIRGIGFLTADRIAASLGIDRHAMIRARAGIGYALSEATNDGHCGLPLAELKEAAARLLEIPAPLIERALELELQAGTVVADRVDGTPVVFLAALHAAERIIALRIRAQAAGALPWPAIDADRAIAWVGDRIGMTLAPTQAEAVRLALRSRFLVITGGPGVGKTTLLKAILEVLRAKRVRLALGAPTGRAAKRMSEATGLEAKTIHRLLEVDPQSGGFRRQESNPLECDLLVVDEMSMVDVPLMHALMRAVPPRAAVLLVGDVDQLPSVGPGRVLADIIESGAVPVVRLTEVFRQASASRIVVNAHRINRGEMPELAPAEPESDFYFWEVGEAEQAAQRLLQVVAQRIPARFGLDAVRDVQVLCPMNRGTLGARSLNAELQKLLNPARDPRIERFGWTFCAGDKVMQVENDYDKDVYNGDLGFIASIDPSLARLEVDFDGRRVQYDVADLDQLVLAYATTIHKAQGSEYPAVVIPVSTQHYTMLQRNLLYTAVTRGRRLVVLIGQRKALGIAVSDRRLRRRWSMLRQWLGGEPREGAR